MALTRLAGARVVTPDGVLDGAVVTVDCETIGAVDSTPEGRQQACDASVDLAGRWLVPGFVDQHVHGGAGAAFPDAGTDPTAAATVVALHRAHGTTTMLASLVTAPLEALVRTVRALAPLVEDGELAGVHLEGPWLSAARCGAHDPALLRTPDRAEAEAVLAAVPGAVRMVTLAPELPGALEAVRVVAAHGARAAIGHTDAAYETCLAAVDAGASVGTHLFNGMRPLHHRDPGPVLALLEDERVVVEVIADGHHLHPALVRDVTAAAPGRTALITDAMGAAGAPDGAYRLGALDVTVAGGIARTAGGALAGSTLTMDAALRNAIAAGVPMVEAVRAVSTTPARVLGLQARTGAIEPGLAADLVVLDGDLRVERVMRRGRWLTSRG